MKDSKLTFDDVNHQGNKALQTLAEMVQQGLITKNTTYSAMVALFTAGRGAFMINGNWEVPTIVDMKKQGKLPFEYGIVPFPKLFDNQDTWADSHQFAIPNNVKKPATPEKIAAALSVCRVCREANDLGWGRSHPGVPPSSRERCLQADVA